MSKHKYITLLTKGPLEKEISDVLVGCGYVLKRESDYQGCITHDYVKKTNLIEVHINNDK